MAHEVLGGFVRAYPQRVVNDRDLSAVDELVSDDYAGSGEGWPRTVDELRQIDLLVVLDLGTAADAG